MQRSESIDRVAGEETPWDIVVVGGGATGLGAAVDAASRGYRVALFEQHDFAKGTSSRSTKLVHGGVRYLGQGNVPLVLEALRERGRLLRNAPHLCRDLEFVIPAYRWWDAPYYGLGLRLYSLLAGRHGIAPARNLSRAEALKRVPTMRAEGLRGGVVYSDGQFDDARLALNLAQTAAEHGGLVLNYARVDALIKEGGRVRGVVVRDVENGRTYDVRAKVVVNATGVFADSVRRMDVANAATTIAPSQGVHIVLDRRFLPGDAALMIPKTEDGRVLFAIPWHNHVVVGTTDTPVENADLEPRALDEELEFLMHHTRLYLEEKPRRSDVRSVFAGLRPLVKPPDAEDTSAISREHTIATSTSGLVTITGGKWTTYRKMAEDVIDIAAKTGELDRTPCVTETLPLHGAAKHDETDTLSVYGSDAQGVRDVQNEQPGWAETMSASTPVTGAQVAWAARHEMARSVEDVLARRTRALFLDAREAMSMAPQVARILASELGRDAAWESAQVEAFNALALEYCMPGDR